MTMTKTQVLALLKKNRNERGIAHWKRKPRELKSFGIGLTQLRKLAKQVGRDHKLALQLWKSDLYDARVIGVLIDEPKKMTREQAKSQIGDVEIGMLAHVYCSCDAALAKTSFARELAQDWMGSKDKVRRRCGYLLLYELAKNTRDKALDDAFFAGHIGRIQKTIQKGDNWVKDAMNASLMGIGRRNIKLNKSAIKAAKAIGAVEIDYGDTSCKPLDVVKHLTSDWLLKKLQA